MVFVILLERVREQALNQRLVEAAFRSETLTSPSDEVDEFLSRLRRPLNFERMQAAVMREVGRI